MRHGRFGAPCQKDIPFHADVRHVDRCSQGRCSHSSPAENGQAATMQTPQGLDATHSGELFPHRREVRCGPPDRSAAHRRPLSRGSSPCGYPHKPLVSYRINQQLSGWIPPLLMIRAFGAHCQDRTPALQQRLAQIRYFASHHISLLLGPLVQRRTLAARAELQLSPT
jgi:hypothetical protein